MKRGHKGMLPELFFSYDKQRLYVDFVLTVFQCTGIHHVTYFTRNILPYICTASLLTAILICQV